MPQRLVAQEPLILALRNPTGDQERTTRILGRGLQDQPQYVHDALAILKEADECLRAGQETFPLSQKRLGRAIPAAPLRVKRAFRKLLEAKILIVMSTGKGGHVYKVNEAFLSAKSET